MLWVWVELRNVELVKFVNKIGVGVFSVVATAISSGSESSNKFTVFVLIAWMTLFVKTGISSRSFGRGGGFDGELETVCSIIPSNAGMNVPIAMVDPLT